MYNHIQSRRFFINELMKEFEKKEKNQILKENIFK